jgi:hypothetical protein
VVPQWGVRTVWQQGTIRNFAKGFGYTSAGQVENPFAGGNTMAEQLAAYQASHGQPGRADDPPETKRLRPIIQRIWNLWLKMEEGPNSPLPRATGGTRDWDINLDGMAHYGLLPDFIEDLRNIGVSQRDVETLYRSADDYITVWQRCEDRRSGQVLLYDAAAGVANLYAMDMSGLWEQRRVWDDWRTTWTSVVAVPDGVLLYDAAAGVANLYAMDMSGLWEQRRVWDDWRTTWTSVAAR